MRSRLSVAISITFCCGQFAVAGTGDGTFQKAKVESTKWSPGITPPVLVEHVDPDYTRDRAFRLYMGGRSTHAPVTVEATIDETGSVRDVVVRNDDRRLKAFEHEAASTVQKWKYRPGLRDGKPIKVRVHIQVNRGVEGQVVSVEGNHLLIDFHNTEPSDRRLGVWRTSPGEPLTRVGIVKLRASNAGGKSVEFDRVLFGAQEGILVAGGPVKEHDLVGAWPPNETVEPVFENGTEVR
jgi:TonB family protein